MLKFLRAERRPAWATAVYYQKTLQLPPGGAPAALFTSGATLRDPRSPHTRADPFLFEKDGKLFLFFETQALDDPGQIEAHEITTAGPKRIGTILKEPFHLSYPHVFKIGAETFMLPETMASGKVRLYRFDEFPRVLTHYRDLLEGSFTDPSPLFFGGFWYLFCTSERGLELFYTDDLAAGDLRLHPSSPITADPRYCRSAGVPFQYAGEWVRPAQDCSNRYGGNVHLIRIDALSPREYRETVVQENIFTGAFKWNARGGHHVNICAHAGGVAVAIDGQAPDSLINKMLARIWMRLFRRQ